MNFIGWVTVPTGHRDVSTELPPGAKLMRYRAKVEQLGRRSTEVRTWRIEGPVRDLGGRDRRMPRLRGLSAFDHKGHLIGLRFGGPDHRANLCPMHGRLNMQTKASPWARMEDEIARALGKDRGYMVVRLRYPAGADYRPSRIHVQLRLTNEGVREWQFPNFSPEFALR